MRRLLFVDDEARILDGLQRMPRPRRAIWTMTFATGGAQALRELASNPFGVVISDIDMHGLDGATQLGRTACEWSGAVAEPDLFLSPVDLTGRLDRWRSLASEVVTVTRTGRI